jgi:hypothetical protein
MASVTLHHTVEFYIDTEYVTDDLPEGWEGWSMHDQEEWTVANGSVKSSDEQLGDETLYCVTWSE